MSALRDPLNNELVFKLRVILIVDSFDEPITFSPLQKIIMMEWHKKGPDALVKHLQEFGFIIFSRMPRSKNVLTNPYCLKSFYKLIITSSKKTFSKQKPDCAGHSSSVNTKNHAISRLLAVPPA